MQRVAAVGTTPSSWNPAARRNLATAKDGELRRDNWLVERFEENRDHLRGGACPMVCVTVLSGITRERCLGYGLGR
jgi:hypothetical protein